MEPPEVATKSDRTDNFSLLLLAFFLSGCSSLGFEMVWLRLLGLALGHESLAMLGALAGFFGGLGLGAWVMDGPIRRSISPARLFVGLELAVAAFGVASPLWLFWLSAQLPHVLGGWAIGGDGPLGLLESVAVAGLGMLPGTFCMGATLPALVEARRRETALVPQGANVGWLYGANTLGAATGLLASVYLVLPALGFSGGAAALALLNVASAILVGWRIRGQAVSGSRAEVLEEEPAAGPGTSGLALGILFFTGLAGLGMEVVGVQIVSQVLYGTVYSFAAVTFAYLAGTALGGILYGQWVHRVTASYWTVTRNLLLGASASAVLCAVLLKLTPLLLRVIERAGGAVPLRMGGELMAGAVAFLLPVTVLGMLYPHLMAPFTGRSFGRAYGLNMIGALLAPVVFGALAIPALGYALAFYLSTGVLLALAAVAAFREADRRAGLIRVFSLGLILLALAPRSLHLVPADRGWTPLFQKEGLFGVVEVSELEAADASQVPARRLRLNTHHYMGGGLSFGERRMGYVPYMLRPDARQVLFLGVGTGATLCSLSGPEVEHVDAVEIVPEVLEVLPYFDGVNDAIAGNPRVTFHTADARRFVAAADRRYDLIVADLFHPGRDGAGSLYTREHFEQVRDHLAGDGLFAQWLPLYQLDEQNLKTIVRTFLAVFPEAHSFLGLYNTQYAPLLLVGGAPGTDIHLNPTRYQAALQANPVIKQYFASVHDYLAAYMLDGRALAHYAGEGPLNTDLNPRILFDAPRAAYQMTLKTQQTLLRGLLAARTGCPEGFVAVGTSPAAVAFHAKTAAFAEAVAIYLEADMRWQGGVTLEGLRAVVDMYLESWRIAPAFGAPRAALSGLLGLEPEIDARIRKGLVQLPQVTGEGTG